MKKLREGELRFVAKPWNKKIWRVYDKVRGSWPVCGPEVGEVPQELKLQAEAEKVAERLNSSVGVQEAEEVRRPGKQRKSSPKKKEELPVEEVIGYDDIDEEAAKKYTEGLF